MSHGQPTMPFLDHPGPLAFAHRGGSGDWPENTMVAFEGAVRLGYRYLETDVHVTADGRLVAFHDDRLDRVTDREGAVAELSWTEVSAARVAGQEPIPLFEEVLAAFPDVRVNVEPKSDLATDVLAEVVHRAGATERVLVSSFADRRVARARALLGPGLCTGLGRRATARLLAAARGAGRPRFAAHAVQVPLRHRGIPIVNRRMVDTAHRLGLAVHVWTIDDPSTMHDLLDLGVDGIMTDRPATLKEVLVGRGQWVA